jgi:hypothetical protein
MTPSTPILDALVAESAYPPMQRIATQEPLTKRERFAMAAMQGFCASPDVQNPSISGIAKSSVMQADALIAALKSTPEPE